MITATAALESGHWAVGDTYDDTGKYCFQGGLCLQNAGGAIYGSLDLVNAIRVSDDVFFYNLGDRMNGPVTRNALYAINYPKAWPLQEWANRFGIGRYTGIDLPGESQGEIASPKLLRALWTRGAAVRYGDRRCYKGRRQASGRAEPVREWNRLRRLRNRQRPNLVDR